MADDSLKQATCPICGYTDSATDADALASSMEEHMRLTHNQILSIGGDALDMKDTGVQVADGITAGPGTTQVVPPNTNAGNYGAFPAPRVVDIPDRKDE